MDQRALTRITIVGGGTAGWLAAAMLARFLSSPEGGTSVAIELIESPNIASVGVGEATVPAMPRTLRQLGISERDFFRRCNASFKLGVRFVNWDVDESGTAQEFVNNFDTIPWVGGHSLASYFTRFGTSRAAGRAGWDFVRAFSAAPDLIEARKGPRPEGGPEFEAAVGYAYHLDAVELAGLLQERARQMGVIHIRDDVEHVSVDERGFVSALTLKERGEWPVEFVIDCTGFRGLIINQALGEPFESFQNYLHNDRALAVQIPHDDVSSLEPCTRSTALGAGWVWRVPLQSRIGTGYVFSSQYRSDDEAAEEFLAHLGPAHADATPRAIPLRIGHSRRSWVNNCLAMGLSGGFIEPLESTAIYMIEMAVRWLISYFPDRDCDPVLAKRFNELMNGFYDEVRDFICLHYRLNNRTDSPYWVAAREELEIPDSLAENLALWRHNLPVPHDLPSKHLFNYDDYILVLIAKGFYRDRIPRPVEALPRGQWERIANGAAAANMRYAAEMPSHYDLVTAIRGEDEVETAESAPAPVFASAAGSQGATVAMPGAQVAPEIRIKPPKDGGNLL